MEANPPQVEPSDDYSLVRDPDLEDCMPGPDF